MKISYCNIKAGRSNVINIAISLKNLRKFANWNFKLVSSGEETKSIRVAGITRQYGLPLLKL